MIQEVKSKHKATLGMQVTRVHPWHAYVKAWLTRCLGRCEKPPTEVEIVAAPKYKASIAAVVTRADGTVEDLGVIWTGDPESC